MSFVNVFGQCVSYFVNRFCQQILSTGFVNRFSQQVMSTGFRFCQQVLSTGFVDRFCQQVLSTGFVNRFCQQVLSTGCVNRFCQHVSIFLHFEQNFHKRLRQTTTKKLLGLREQSSQSKTLHEIQKIGFNFVS